MDVVIFDGCAFAANKEQELKKEVVKLKKKGITPKLVSILVGNDPASHLYVNLKEKAAKRIGCKLEIIHFPEDTPMIRIIGVVKRMGSNNKVHGIMVQLPLPDNFSEKDRDEIINSISKEKDVDGLREDSPYLTPTVKSVLFALKQASENIVRPNTKVLVVGYSGFEGEKIYKVLSEMGYDVEGANSKTKDFEFKTRNADILISATGSSGIIKGNMIKDGAIVIDVGAPRGDVIKREVIGKASFLSPVPGGIGPVTIVSLLENLVYSCK
jgi:methylenetetrahydrofolate dehydrogenase (NADP+) / methenyltetrahydrofolate cyclohydrolase